MTFIKFYRRLRELGCYADAAYHTVKRLEANKDGTLLCAIREAISSTDVSDAVKTDLRLVTERFIPAKIPDDGLGGFFLPYRANEDFMWLLSENAELQRRHNHADPVQQS